MKNKLYIMSGCPGSGKSTFAKKYLTGSNTLYISRDEIRFSLIKENEKYFSKEKQVYQSFVNKINTALAEGYNVIADATHLNRKSRSKLFFSLYSNLIDTEVIVVTLKTPLELCIERNELRKGTRSYVPYQDLCKMFYSYEEPSFDENKNIISKIIEVFPNNDINIKER